MCGGEYDCYLCRNKRETRQIMKINKLTLVCWMALAACGCGSVSGNRGSGSEVAAGDSIAAADGVEFDADSAMSYAGAQVAFGPRVPGSREHAACVGYLTDFFRSHGADSVWVERGVMPSGSVKMPIANIRARYNGEAPKRILLVAHYDTRPWGDMDEREEMQRKPIDGANDGASGVAVIMELARQMSLRSPQTGVDILLSDGEDSGDGEGIDQGETSWCKGTQMWADSNPYAGDVKPSYGVVLDMVGGRDARFHREYYSQQLAPAVVNKVWGAAAAAGYASRFDNGTGGPIVDDHLFVNRAGIPCIDVIESRNARTGSFPSTWHTHNDNMENLDAATLKAVGQTMVELIYSER